MKLDSSNKYSAKSVIDRFFILKGSRSRFGAYVLSVIAVTMTSALSFGQSASSAQDSPWETRAIFGINQVDSTSIRTSFPGESNVGEVDFGSGIAFGGSVGYNFQNNLFLELEYTWRNAEEGDAPETLFGPGTTADASSVIISPNLWYRPIISESSKFKPRFGIGFGWFQEVSMDAERNGIEESFDGDGSGLLLMAGFDWALTDKWRLGLDAKYYDGGSIEATSEADSSRSVSFDYSGLSFDFSLGFRF